MIFVIIWAVIATVTALFLYISNKNKWKKADKLLDDVISNRKADVSELSESELSLFASRIDRISEKLQIEIGRAEDEKEEVKQLISNISHQLKTPLSNVVMYSQLLQDNKISDEQRAEFTEKLRSHTEHLDWILNSLFKMTKLERDVISFETEELSVKETLVEAVNAVYEKAESAGIEISLDVPQDKKLLHNRKWTAEVFVNLLENAIKYSPAGGRIDIHIEPYEMYSGIVISDNGIGIKEEEQSLIFQRFYRSSDVQDITGSGIGLYLSKTILEKEKGYMTVASEYGKGSSFTVYLRNSSEA